MNTEERLTKLKTRIDRREAPRSLVAGRGGLKIVGVPCGLDIDNDRFAPPAQAQGANNGPKVIPATHYILDDETGKTTPRWR